MSSVYSTLPIVIYFQYFTSNEVLQYTEKSRWQDLNLWPPAPKADALPTALHPVFYRFSWFIEGGGFEPPMTV